MATHDIALQNSQKIIWETTHPEVSPDLYNKDLAPTSRKDRSWSTFSICALWINDVHNLGNYSFAIGLLSLGMNGTELALSLGLGSIFLFVLLSLSGYMGVKTGVPFPVLCRISFGIRGAHFPALVRGLVATVWFGIQTYLASIVLTIMLTTLWPSLKPLTEPHVLGLSHLGWISFLLLWITQLGIACYGMEAIRRYEAFSGPLILITFISLAGWIAYASGGHFVWPSPHSSQPVEAWKRIAGAAVLWVAVYGTFILSFCDFTRHAKSFGAVIRGNFWGLPINIMIFTAIALSITGGQLAIDGELIKGPTDIVSKIPYTPALILACLSLLMLTIAVNLMANFVAAAYAFTNYFPNVLTFRSATVITAIVGLVILPWNLYNSPNVIMVFLNGIGLILGPIFGVIATDYWFIRLGKIDVVALYSDAKAEPYFYTNGFNVRAIGSVSVAGFLCLLIELAPALGGLANISWLLGAITAALIYALISPRQTTSTERDGEAIAVSSKH